MGGDYTAGLVHCDQHLCEDFFSRDLGIYKCSWDIGEGIRGHSVVSSSGDTEATMGRCISFFLRSPK